MTIRRQITLLQTPLVRGWASTHRAGNQTRIGAFSISWIPRYSNHQRSNFRFTKPDRFPTSLNLAIRKTAIPRPFNTNTALALYCQHYHQLLWWNISSKRCRLSRSSYFEFVHSTVWTTATFQSSLAIALQWPDMLVIRRTKEHLIRMGKYSEQLAHCLVTPVTLTSLIGSFIVFGFTRHSTTSANTGFPIKILFST